ncbi:MAG: hypothetical protein HON70_43750, partial [Lentisphaerae bacterium]|nr:hypothetical protein [Lentisphaerota bacterium]
NVTTVDLGTNVDILTENGNLDIVTGVTSINFSDNTDAGLNDLHATSGHIDLADLTDSGNVAEVQIRADGSISLDNVTLGTTTLLDIDVDLNAAVADTLQVDGTLLAQSLTADGRTDDVMNFTDTVTTNEGAILINTDPDNNIADEGAAIVNFDGNVTSATSITIEEVSGDVDMATGITVEAQNGDISIVTGVTEIDLDGTAGEVTIQTTGGTGNITLSDVNDSAAAAGNETSLIVTSTDGAVSSGTITIANIGQGSAQADAIDYTNITAEGALSVGPITATGRTAYASNAGNAVVLSETAAGSIDLQGAITTNAGDIAINTNQVLLALDQTMSATDGVIDIGNTANAAITLQPEGITQTAVLTSTEGGNTAGQINIFATEADAGEAAFSMTGLGRLVTTDTAGDNDEAINITATGSGNVVINSSNSNEVDATTGTVTITATAGAGDGDVTLGSDGAAALNMNVYSLIIDADGTATVENNVNIDAQPVLVRAETIDFDGDINESSTATITATAPGETYSVALLASDHLTIQTAASIVTTGGTVILSADSDLSGAAIEASDDTGDVTIVTGASIDQQNANGAVWIGGINAVLNGSVTNIGQANMNRAGATTDPSAAAPDTEPVGIAVLAAEDISGSGTLDTSGGNGSIIMLADFDFARLDADNDGVNGVDDVQFGTPDMADDNNGSIAFTGTSTSGGDVIYTAPEDIAQDDDIIADNDVIITSTLGDISVASGVTVSAQGNITLTASDTGNTANDDIGLITIAENASVIANQTLALTAEEDIVINGNIEAVSGNFEITTGDSGIGSNGSFTVGETGSVTVRSGNLVIGDDTAIGVTPNFIRINEESATPYTQNGALSVTGAVTIDFDQDDITGPIAFGTEATIGATGDVTIVADAGGDYDVTGGVDIDAQDISITASGAGADITVEDIDADGSILIVVNDGLTTGNLTAAGETDPGFKAGVTTFAIAIDAGGDVVINGTTTANAVADLDVYIDPATVTINSSVETTGNYIAWATGAITVNADVTSTGGDVILHADDTGADVVDGTPTYTSHDAAGNLLIDEGVTIRAGDLVSLAGENVTARDVTAGTTLAITADTTVTLGGDLLAAGPGAGGTAITFTDGGGDLDVDLITDVSLTAINNGIDMNTTTLDGNYALDIDAGTGANADVTLGTIGGATALQSVTVSAIGTGTTTLNGNITTVNDLNLSAATDVNLVGARTLTSNLGNVHVDGGDVAGAGLLTLA